MTYFKELSWCFPEPYIFMYIIVDDFELPSVSSQAVSRSSHETIGTCDGRSDRDRFEQAMFLSFSISSDVQAEEFSAGWHVSLQFGGGCLYMYVASQKYIQCTNWDIIMYMFMYVHVKAGDCVSHLHV